MSCQSLAARAFAENDKDMAHCTTFHRSVRFSSDSRGSGRASNDQDKKETSGSISLTALAVPPVTSQCSSMSQSVPSNSLNFDLDVEVRTSSRPGVTNDQPGQQQTCRFPKLEECAHFHYERVALGGLSIEVVPCEDECTDSTEEGWICLRVRSHVNSCEESAERAISASWSEASDVREWTLARNRDHLLRLDEILHRCIYDRKVSGLPNLSTELVSSMDEEEYTRLISDYMHHLSIIADDSINCGPALNWLQMDNRGHKLLVANEDSSSINTPAVAAAYSVRKYVSQARDEISFEVGDMISIIDMPGPQESLWWRGKRGFRVGFFPHHCVAVIGDKVPRHMTQPPPIVGSVAVAPIKPVLRKHGKLISLFRSFILSRPSRRSLKQQGILRERVFGCDLGEHLLNCGHTVPQVLVECAAAIESRGAVDGVYRLSGGSGLTQRLRSAFDCGQAPDLSRAPDLAQDPHAVPSLLKMYFRELPNPLCTYQLYESFVHAVQLPEESAKLRAVRQTVVKLPPPHYRTLAYLMRHLRRVSLLGGTTGMTPRNMAIVWAPNLLRAPRHHHALQGVAVQAVVTEFLICYAEELFAQEQGADSEPESLEEEIEPQVELRGSESGRRPKSLPVNPPTKLLSLEEARRRGLPAGSAPPALPLQLPPPSGAIAAAAAAAAVQLRPSTHLKPKYIEVGSGPNNLPQYHTVLDLPLSGTKRGLKRSPSGWRGLFTRSHKQQRPRGSRPPAPAISPPAPTPLELQDISMGVAGLRPVKSCESLTSDTDTLAPLAERASAPLKHHTRSSSCDSYFEPWQAELAEMRLRLSPQERDHHMFSEEDDTQQAVHQGDSLCSTPPESGLCSVDPSPRRNLRVDIEAATELAEKRRHLLEEQLSQIGYIDGESPRARAPPEKRHQARPPSPPSADVAKRLCKDRESPKASISDFQTCLGNVKLRERGSPRKSKTRYSGLHHPIEPNEKIISRLSWHGKDGHSTLIKIDWPIENSISNLTSSTINSSPLTPITPVYDPLETDSEISESNKHTIKIQSDNCLNCDQGTCLKCELKATDYNHTDSIPSPITSDVSYQNLNRLSAVSTSSSDHNTDKKDAKMTSSHESTSSSNQSNHDELYECYNFTRPNYINLTSSSKSSPGSPLKSPLKSTISITFRSPTKSKDGDRDSVYEDIDLEKILSIEEATIPQADASLPTQQASQPDFNQDLIILDTPTETHFDDDIDVYSQVKFFKKSIEEVNAMILESPDKEKDVLEESVFLTEETNYTESDFMPKESYMPNESSYMPNESSYMSNESSLTTVYTKTHYETKESGHFMTDEATNHFAPELSNHCVTESSHYMPKESNHYVPEESKNHYENMQFKSNDYENINVDTLKICDKLEIEEKDSILKDELHLDEVDNGNVIKKVEAKNLNVRELAIRFESPTEQKGPFTFEKFKTEVKYPSLERKDDIIRVAVKSDQKPTSPKNYKLSKNSARSLDENAFIKEFGSDKNRRKSLEVRDARKHTKCLPDLNLNIENTKECITPTSENKISLIQRFNEKRPAEIKSIIGFEAEKKLSRERIEKYKEERRNFLREKYSSQSFRSNPEQLTRIKLKKDEKDKEVKFERRNTVDLGQRMRFSLAKSDNNLDTIQSPSPENKELTDFDDRKDKMSPSFHIKDMAAMFEQKQNPHTG